jgi:glutamine synthetase
MNLSLQGSQFVAGVLHHLPALRLCPAASPYLALAVLVQAGLDGIRRRLPLDAHRPQPLPDNLGHALDLLESSAAAEWLGADVLAAYVCFKRAEIAALDDVDEGEICRRYAEVY